MTEKIQKILANLGLSSRRTIETWIEDGRITVNGQIATLGQRITLSDKLTLDGKTIKLQPSETLKQRTIIYYKPEGELCSRQTQNELPTVFDGLPAPAEGRWIMVGRLDLNSMGLLLFTTDGELAHRLMHPSYQIEREYSVRVLGSLTPAMQQKLLHGIMLEDGRAKLTAIKEGGGSGVNQWYHITLQEGRNREVRRMFDYFELTVNRLIRIRYGEIKLPKELRVGHYSELHRTEIDSLRELVGLPSKKNSR